MSLMIWHLSGNTSTCVNRDKQSFIHSDAIKHLISSKRRVPDQLIIICDISISDYACDTNLTVKHNDVTNKIKDHKLSDVIRIKIMMLLVVYLLCVIGLLTILYVICVINYLMFVTMIFLFLIKMMYFIIYLSVYMIVVGMHICLKPISDSQCNITRSSKPYWTTELKTNFVNWLNTTLTENYAKLKKYAFKPAQSLSIAR